MKRHLMVRHVSSLRKRKMDDDGESIITNQRYAYINTLMQNAVKKGKAKGSLSVSDKIDRVVDQPRAGAADFRAYHVPCVLHFRGRRLVAC